MNSKNQFLKGFSLLEILIVIVILGILTSIAIPIYNHEVVKARRAEAQVALLSLAATVEHYYIEHHSYQGVTVDTNTNSYSYYRLTIETPTATTYTLTAIPIGLQLTNDTQCGALSINQLGVKMISGIGSVSQCWK